MPNNGDGGFLRITGKLGAAPMSGTIRQAGFGEGPGVWVFLNGVMGVLVATLLFASQGTHPEAGLLTNPTQSNWLQNNRQAKFFSVKAPGTTVIYSLQPWGGVRVDDVEGPLFAIWDVSILPSMVGDNLPLTTTDMSRVANSEAGIKRENSRSSVQFLRFRNLNWTTTS